MDVPNPLPRNESHLRSFLSEAPSSTGHKVVLPSISCLTSWRDARQQTPQSLPSTPLSPAFSDISSKPPSPLFDMHRPASTPTSCCDASVKLRHYEHASPLPRHFAAKTELPIQLQWESQHLQAAPRPPPALDGRDNDAIHMLLNLSRASVHSRSSPPPLRLQAEAPLSHPPPPQISMTPRRHSVAHPHGAMPCYVAPHVQHHATVFQDSLRIPPPEDRPKRPFPASRPSATHPSRPLSRPLQQHSHVAGPSRPGKRLAPAPFQTHEPVYKQPRLAPASSPQSLRVSLVPSVVPQKHSTAVKMISELPSSNQSSESGSQDEYSPPNSEPGDDCIKAHKASQFGPIRNQGGRRKGALRETSVTTSAAPPLALCIEPGVSNNGQISAAWLARRPPAEDFEGVSAKQAPHVQKTRFAMDQYTPHWIRGSGPDKEGWCALCGEGKWLQLKNSAFWYHKQFAHGVSSTSGHPFAEPVQKRNSDDGSIEGLCQSCNKWQKYKPKRCKANKPGVWWKHAHNCHVYSTAEAKTKDAISAIKD